MNVVFRADASLEMGTGHVMRCLTLADELKRRGHDTLFISRLHPGHLCQWIGERGHSYIGLPYDPSFNSDSLASSDLPVHSAWLGASWQTDAEQTKEALAQFSSDWLIVDHYALDQRWQQQLRPCYQQLMVIDDLADRPHQSDLLLDQTFGRNPLDYRRWVPEHCVVLAGAEYALLRPEFSEYRAQSLERRQTAALKQVLVTMGGVDKDNATGKLLDVLRDCLLPSQCRITVVMGPTAPWIDSVTEQARSLPWDTRIMTNVTNMAQLMSASDLAIGAAGSTSWERCCLGLPCLMLVLAQNQQHAAKLLEQANAAIMIALDENLSSKFGRALSELINDPSQLKQMSVCARQISDGTGVHQVVAHLEKQTYSSYQ